MALTALSEDWAVEVVSWLPDAERSLARTWRGRPRCMLRAAALSTVRPVSVAVVQSLAPRSLARRCHDGDLVLFLTDRAVPWTRSPGRAPYIIDFIDDLGGAALRRGLAVPGPRSWFWRWEGWRIRRLDARLARQAVGALAITKEDAAAIGPEVGAVRAAFATRSAPPVGTGTTAGTKVVFTGNLFYPPNLDAAMWICDQLAPELRRRGVDPGTVVVAGRRPSPALIQRAAAAGVVLRADVADLGDIIDEAAIVLSPVVFGSGVQNKVLDAVGSRRPCILTPYSNAPLGLVDGRSALVRPRDARAFAQAIVDLLGDPPRRERLAEAAIGELADYSPEAVAESWRGYLRRIEAR